MLTASQRAAFLQDSRRYVAAGWTQNAYVRSFAGAAVAIDSRSVRRVCAAGAVDRAGIANGLNYDEREQLRADLRAAIDDDQVQEHAGRHGRDDDLLLERWNDAPGRTRSQVLALYDAAIARLRQTP